MTDEKNAELVELTEDTIRAASTKELRELADAHLSGYNKSQDVLEVRLTNQVVAHPGTLTKVDALVQAIKAAHKGEDPKVTTSYGRLTVSVWDTDDQLRDQLVYARNRAIKAAADASSE